MVAYKQVILAINLDKKGGSHISFSAHCVTMTQPT